MSTKSNTEHLHEEGVINKEELTKEHVKAIDGLSKDEVEQLKSINKSVKKVSPGVGIML
ncbi:hypothetical protein Q4489_14710 [Thalassotalea sp. 1_MG-2023]|uniref:hypothetical protein n=1 Tax=Thalassotalea sp. 1_MG-2023 TaxID=3062680 RepID=UPI0026E396C4|nr:hypothetical protein [Thalassotalea sp. 1_MG-2023]MDO6428269.1 hypothetical protein [Thalassotalea sp. 1_MG-2023]